MRLTKRQGQILEILRQRKSAHVSELSELFKLTTASIRLDFAELEDAGYIHRFHGGARLIEPPAYEGRLNVNLAVKKKIARKALELIQPGETVFLDSGTTVLMLARELTQLDRLTIVTNSFPVVSYLGREPDKNIIFIGGEYSYSAQCCVGMMMEKNLENVFVSKTFMGTDSIDIDNGILSSNISRLAYINKVITNSRETILLVDSSKFRHVGVLKIADVTDIDLIITDSEVPEKSISTLRDKGIKVTIAD
jgi:DeoR/GlpR family transcriptional regulator of sugar metabolism